MQQNTAIRCSKGTASEKCEDQDHDGDSVMRHTMRTLAPKACGGRLDLNFDLTTPLLPCGRVTRLHDHKHTRLVGNTKTLPPDDANLRPCDFPLGPVYICYTLHERHGSTQSTKERQDSQVAYLSEVELSILLGRDTLNLKEGSVRTGVALATLMTENAPFAVESIGEKSGESVLDPVTSSS